MCCMVACAWEKKQSCDPILELHVVQKAERWFYRGWTQTEELWMQIKSPLQ